MIFLLLNLLGSSPALGAEISRTHLQYSAECILRAVSQRKGISLRAEVPMPKIFLEKDISLQQFQDAVEPQWGMRPDVFLNVFVAAKNEIYLMDDAAYYGANGRFLDDSLAHELTHYLQVKYQGAKLEEAGDYLEPDAVEMQTWFRETFMRTGKSPCP